MAYPRRELERRDTAELEAACGELAYGLIRQLVKNMDGEAPGGVSAHGTIIAALVVRCHDLYIQTKERGPL